MGLPPNKKGARKDFPRIVISGFLPADFPSKNMVGPTEKGGTQSSATPHGAQSSSQRLAQFRRVCFLRNEKQNMKIRRVETWGA